MPAIVVTGDCLFPGGLGNTGKDPKRASLCGRRTTRTGLPRGVPPPNGDPPRQRLTIRAGGGSGDLSTRSTRTGQSSTVVQVTADVTWPARWEGTGVVQLA